MLETKKQIARGYCSARASENIMESGATLTSSSASSIEDGSFQSAENLLKSGKTLSLASADSAHSCSQEIEKGLEKLLSIKLSSNTPKICLTNYEEMLQTFSAQAKICHLGAQGALLGATAQNAAAGVAQSMTESGGAPTETQRNSKSTTEAKKDKNCFSFETTQSSLCTLGVAGISATALGALIKNSSNSKQSPKTKKNKVINENQKPKNNKKNELASTNQESTSVQNTEDQSSYHPTQSIDSAKIEDGSVPVQKELELCQSSQKENSLNEKVQSEDSCHQEKLRESTTHHEEGKDYASSRSRSLSGELRSQIESDQLTPSIKNTSMALSQAHKSNEQNEELNTVHQTLHKKAPLESMGASKEKTQKQSPFKAKDYPL